MFNITSSYIDKYNSINAKLTNSQLKKLKSWMKLGAKVILNLSSDVTGDSHD